MSEENEAGSERYLSKEEVPEEVKFLISEEVKKAIKSEISIDKGSFTTVFGVFASIVVFLSVEVQFFKTITYFMNIVGFSLIILSTLLTFVFLLDYICRGYRNSFKNELKEFPWLIFIIIALVFIGGCLFLRPIKEEVFKENLVFKKYERDFKMRQDELEMIYNLEIKNLQTEINNIQVRIENLEKHKT